MKTAALISFIIFSAPAAFCQVPWHQLPGRETVIPMPAETAGIPDSCPKFRALKAADGYDEAPAVREVSAVAADSLPLPADDLEKSGIIEILKTDLDYWNSRPDNAQIQVGPDFYNAPRLRSTIRSLLEIFSSDWPPEELRRALKDRFKVYRASADDGTGKTVITGYYEAEIPVTRTPDAAHKYPVHLRPADLIRTTPGMGADFDYGRYDETGKLTPHYATAEVHTGKLDGQGLEMAWSAHPAQIMLLQIQGSGVLRFPDGDYMRAGFDGANGWPYRSVQKILMDCGETPSMSFKNFIKYLSAQGPREERLADLNPRYIYFQQRAKDSLPYGAIGKALTPGRSIAIDPKYIPYGLFGLLKSKRPVARGDTLAFADFARFVSTHDTGSAIRGPGRVDLFWGTGDTAETEASSMKAPGELYFFIEK